MCIFFMCKNILWENLNETWHLKLPCLCISALGMSNGVILKEKVRNAHNPGHNICVT